MRYECWYKPILAVAAKRKRKFSHWRAEQLTWTQCRIGALIASHMMQKANVSYNLHRRHIQYSTSTLIHSFVSLVFAEWQMQIELWLYPTPCPPFLPPFAFFACFISTNRTIGLTQRPRFTRDLAEWQPLRALAEFEVVMRIFSTLATVLGIGDWMLSALTRQPTPKLVSRPLMTKAPMAPLHLKSTLLVIRWFSSHLSCPLFRLMISLYIFRRWFAKV